MIKCHSVHLSRSPQLRHPDRAIVRSDHNNFAVGRDSGSGNLAVALGVDAEGLDVDQTSKEWVEYLVNEGILRREGKSRDVDMS